MVVASLESTFDFVVIKVDFFWGNNESQEFAAGYPKKRFSEVHFQLISHHNIDHRP